MDFRNVEVDVDRTCEWISNVMFVVVDVRMSTVVTSITQIECEDQVA